MSALIIRLFAAAVLTIAVVLIVVTYRSQGSASVFNQWVGWANVIAAAASLITLVLTLRDRLPGPRTSSADELPAIADRLAAGLLKEQQRRLSELIGTNVPESHPAVVSFRVTDNSGKRAKTASTNEGRVRRNITDLARFYRERTSGRLVMLGGPGAGKTVFGMQLAVDLLRARKPGQQANSPEATAPMPVLFSLPTWDADQPMEVWLSGVIADRFAVTRQQAQQLISGGFILPILDDLDGMDGHDGSLDRSRAAVRLLNTYLAATPEAKVVVICRKERRYERLVTDIRHACQIVLEPLTPAAISSYIKAQCTDQRSREDWADVFTELHGPRSALLCGAIGTPWRLTAAMTFYRDGGDPRELVPSAAEEPETNTGYADRIKTLLISSFVDARIRIYAPRRYRNSYVYLACYRVARHLETMEGNGYSGTDITLHTWWKGSNSKEIRSHHIWMTWIMVTLLIGGSFNFQAVRDGIDGWQGAAGIIGTYVMFKLLIVDAVQQDRKPYIVHFGALRRRGRGRRILVGGIAVVAFMAVLSNLAFGIGYAVLLCGAILATVIMAAASVPADGIVMGPKDAIRRDLINHAVGGVAVGLALSVGYSKIYNPTLGMLIGLANALGWLSASAWARYVIAVSMTMPRHRLGAFLNWAHKAGIMRVSGTSYQFRHAELQQWFTAAGEPRTARPSPVGSHDTEIAEHEKAGYTHSVA